MEYNESQRDVTPDTPENKPLSQNVDEMSVAAAPVKNIMAALGLVPPLPSSPGQSFDELLLSLHSPDRSLRIATVRTLAYPRDALPLVALQQALHHEDEAVRAAAVGVIGSWKENAPIELLLQSLHDSAWYVRACAAHELGLQIARAPLLPLIEAMHDIDESVRAEAVWALSMLQEHTPEVLLDALHDPSWLVREAAKHIMQQRIEQAIDTTVSEEHELPEALSALPEEALLHPSHTTLNARLPNTGPLTQPMSLDAESPGTQRQDPLLLPAEDVWSRPRKRRSREQGHVLQKRQPNNHLFEKLLAAILILGLGLGWYSLNQLFHQSSSASQGTFTCVFHPGSNPPGNVMAWSPNKSPAASALLAVAVAGGKIEIYDADTCRHITEYQPSGVILAMQWITEGLRVAVLTTNGHLEILQENENVPSQLLLDLSSSSATSTARPLLAWSEDGHHIAVNWGDNMVRIWSLSEKNILLATYQGSYGPISALALSPYGTEIAVAAFDSTNLSWPVDIWSVTNQAPVTTVGIYASARIATMAWSQDAKILLCYDQSNLVTRWNQSLGPVSLSTTDYIHLQQPISLSWALAWAPDNTRFVMTTTADMQIRNATTDSLLATIPDEIGQINQLSWSLNGKYIASASISGTVQLWDVKN
jgi:hypothetical protein